MLSICQLSVLRCCKTAPAFLQPAAAARDSVWWRHRSFARLHIDGMGPQVYVDGEFIGGSDILMGLHQSGELESMLRGSAKTESA